jgi:hypothetical protein
MSTVPPLFVQFVDDAAVFPPGNATLVDAATAHRRHRTAWYAELIGPLLLRPDDLDDLHRTAPAQPHPGADVALRVGVVGELGRVGALNPVAGVQVVQVEAAVAKRGQDPLPGLRDLLGAARHLGEVDIFAEIPLTWGLLGALDGIADARGSGMRIAPKFRTGGLAAELFPTPAELAAVICACAQRQLPFKLTAGLHRAVRHNDPETGFTHHGFLNLLVASLLAASGAGPVDVAERLATTDAGSLIEAVVSQRERPRPLWTGFGSCSVDEPVDDLRALGLVGPPQARMSPN